VGSVTAQRGSRVNDLQTSPLWRIERKLGGARSESNRKDRSQDIICSDRSETSG
jgi:hypothetical protein